MLVPSLLEVIALVAVAIAVTEGDDFYMIIGPLVGSTVEMVMHLIAIQQGPATCEDLYQACLTGGIGADDGNLFAREDLQRDGSRHPKGGMTGHAVDDGKEGRTDLGGRRGHSGGGGHNSRGHRGHRGGGRGGEGFGGIHRPRILSLFCRAKSFQLLKWEREAGRLLSTK